MLKVFSTSLFLMLGLIGLLDADAPKIGTRFEKTVGTEVANCIANAEEMTATDLATENQFPLTTKQLESFKKFVLSDSGYVFDYKKRCLFVPQILYTIKDNPEVKVIVSIVCNQIRFDSPNGSIILDDDLVKKEFNKLNKNIIKTVKEEQ